MEEWDGGMNGRMGWWNEWEIRWWNDEEWDGGMNGRMGWWNEWKNGMVE